MHELSKEYQTHALCCLIKKDDLLYQTELKEHHFEDYGVYFQSMLESKLADGKVDLPKLVGIVAAKTNQPPKDVADFFYDAMANFVLATNFSAYEKWLINYYHTRRAVEVARNLMGMAMEPDADANMIYDYLAKQTMDYAPVDDIKTQTDVIREFYDQQKNQKLTPTGFRGFDQLTGGLRAGCMYGFGGYAKSGKTMFAGTISGNLGMTGHKHLYVAMEMGAAHIEARQQARFSGCRIPDLKEPDYAMIKNNTLYSDAAGISWGELQQKMLLAVHKHKVEGVIIDYWQLITGQNPRETEEKHLRDIAQGLADFAKKHSIWIILLAQTNDDGKIFAGRGLTKACDVLMTLQEVEGDVNQRWLRMEATRSTQRLDLGDNKFGYLTIDANGPYMRENF